MKWLHLHTYMYMYVYTYVVPRRHESNRLCQNLKSDPNSIKECVKPVLSSGVVQSAGTLCVVEHCMETALKTVESSLYSQIRKGKTPWRRRKGGSEET